MADVIEARVKQKKNTLENWEANPMIILDGEQAFVVGSTGQPINFKIGDGTKRFSDLPYWIQYDQAAFIPVSGLALPTPTQPVGYSILGEGTYTHASGDVVVPDGHWGVANWDGSAWSFSDMGELPQTELSSTVNQDVDKAITPKGVYDVVDKIADIPVSVPVTYGRGYWHSNKSFISDAGLPQKYLSTGLMTTEGGTTYSLKGYKSGSNSGMARIQVWVGSVMSTVNIGTTTQYTYTTPEGATDIAVVIAFEGTGTNPDPFMQTFQMVEGTNFNYQVKVEKSTILSKVDANDFFEITPSLPVLLDKTKRYETFKVIREIGDVWGSASNNLTFDRVEVTGGSLISMSPIRAFAEYDENDEFIEGTWKGSSSNFQSYSFNLQPNTVFIRATVPQDGGNGVTSNLNDFKVIYGDATGLSKTVIYDVKTVGGGNINVYSSDNSGGGSGSVAEETIKNNESQNSIIKDVVENQQMLNSLLAIKSTDSVDKNIVIPGKSEGLANYVQRLHIHWGAQQGDTLFDEVFMNESCKKDFSDLRFIDENGNNLDFIIHSHGNYEFIKDNAVLLNNVVQYTSDGKLVMSYNNSGTTRNLRISSNNGASWTILHNNVMLLYIDSRDTIFVFRHADYKMFRLLSSDNYATLHEVLDLSSTQSDIRPLSGFCEDQNGHLYCGKYQEPWDVQIFKSTDQGATWITVYRDLVNNQHVHHISFDQYTNTIYAGLDGAKNYLDPVKRAKNIKSTDGGATWTVVPNPYPNSDYGLAFYGNGYRLGFGETSILGGPTIYKTFDDINYYPVLNTNQGIRKIVEIDGVLYAGGNAGQATRNAQIYKSIDQGETWETVFWEDWQDTASAGDAVRYFSNYQTPMGQNESQMIIGGNGSYSRLRLFQGGDRYQALVFVKVGSLPTSGRIIKVSTDYLIAYPNRSVGVEVSDDSLKGYLKINEGRGNSMLDSVTKSFVNGSVEWQNDFRRFNSPYPYSLRDYLPSGIRLLDGSIRLTSNFNLPHKNFSVSFFANFFGEHSADKKFLFGDPEGVHFYYQNTGIYVSNGLSNYVCYGLEMPLAQDFYNFYVLSVSNDATPVFKFTIGDNQSLNRVMTTWANRVSSKTYLLGSGAGTFSKSNCKIHSLMVFNREITPKEGRSIYFGSDIV